MAEYIDKQLLIRILLEKSDVAIDDAKKTLYANMARMVKLHPPDDVAPVLHGRWIGVSDEFAQCSMCKYPVHIAWSITKYCPNCGAKMDREVRDNG